MGALTDDDGVDGPFERNMKAAERADKEVLKGDLVDALRRSVFGLRKPTAPRRPSAARVRTATLAADFATRTAELDAARKRVGVLTECLEGLIGWYAPQVFVDEDMTIYVECDDCDARVRFANPGDELQEPDFLTALERLEHHAECRYVYVRNALKGDPDASPVER